MRLRNGPLRRLAVLTLVLCLVVEWSGLPRFLLAQSRGSPAAPGRHSKDELKRWVAEAQRTFASIEASDQQLPRDSFEPETVVDKVGHDPSKLFEWVRDNTYWVPYRGALRAATGVLMDRLGNSLDRALLLAELLHDAGQTVRLARAELTEDQARSLLPKVRPLPELRSPVAAPSAVESGREARVAKVAKDYNLDPARLKAYDQQVALQGEKFAEDVVQRVAEQTVMLAGAVGKPSEEHAKAERDRAAGARIESLRDHWWAQRQEAGSWIDLDPTASDAQPGQAPAQPAETLAPDLATGKFALDGKWCHEVWVKVVVEQSAKSGRKENTVLSHALRPCDLFGQPVVLQHHPMHWPGGLNLLEEKQPLEKLKSTVLAQDEWLPVLTIGSTRVIQSSFTDAGETIANGQARLQSILDGAAAGKRVQDILRSGRIGATGGEGRAAEQDSGVLTAEWIDYEFHVPGQEMRTVRRQVFDLIGPGARAGDDGGAQPPPQRPDELARLVRGLAVMGQTQMLPLACHLSGAFVEHLANQNLLAHKDLLMQPSTATTQPEYARWAADRLGKLGGFPSPLYMWAVARQQYNRFGCSSHIPLYHNDLRYRKVLSVTTCHGATDHH